MNQTSKISQNQILFKLIIPLLSTLTFLTYIMCTYFPIIFSPFRYIDMVACCVFLSEEIYLIIKAQHRIAFIFSLDSILNILTSVPPFFVFLADDPFEDWLYMFINASRVIRVLRLWQLVNMIQWKVNKNTKQLISFGCSMLQIIFIFAGLAQIVEYSELKYRMKITHNELALHNLTMRSKYHHYIYFLIVTCSLVGFGDIYPFSALGKVVTLITIFITVSYVSYQISIFVQIASSVEEYKKNTYSANKDTQHVMLTGNISLDSLQSFAQEFFHPDHGEHKRHVVILSLEPPSLQMEKLIRDINGENNNNKVVYLQGNPSEPKDLLRADIHKAKACFIFTDKTSADPLSYDRISLQLALRIKKQFYYINESLTKNASDLSEVLAHSNPSFHLCMQFNKEQSMDSYYTALTEKFVKTMKKDQMVITESIKMNLLSKSCLTPGIMALLTNLVMSCGNLKGKHKEWQNEYAEGREHEIYRIQLQYAYKKMTFLELVQHVYDKEQAIIFALELEVQGVSVLKLNPTANTKITDLIAKAKDINSSDKTKESKGGYTVKDNSFTSEIMNDKSGGCGVGGCYGSNNNKNVETKVRIFAYMICSDKDVADRIANHEKEKPSSSGSVKLSEGDDNKEVANILNVLPEMMQSLMGNIRKQNCNVHNMMLQHNEDELFMMLNDKTKAKGVIELPTYDMALSMEDYYFNPGLEMNSENKKDIVEYTIKDRSDITNHIVICGIHPALIHFILPLRAKYLQKDSLKWIVILAPILPPSLFEELSKFSKIIFIQGAPQLTDNLHRANIMNADKAVIFSSTENLSQINETTHNHSNHIDNNNSSNNSNSSSNNDNNTNNDNSREIPDELQSDRETTFIYRAIRACNKNVQIMVELVCPKSIELLLSLDELTTLKEAQDKSTQYEFTSLYASGELFTPSIIDRITCQSFYNPHIVTIIELILGGTFSSTYHKSKKLDDYIQLTGSNLYLVKAPERYVNNSFSQLFNYLIKNNKAVAIALYRMNLNEGFYYVYTNPNKNTLIKASDLVFVLADAKNIIGLIEERKETMNEDGNSLITEESQSEEEEAVNEEETNKNGVVKERDGNKKDTDVIMNEDIQDKLNKLEEIKKEIKMAKHEELDRLRKKNFELQKELKMMKNMLVGFPEFVKNTIDKEFDMEIGMYLGKK